MSRTDAERGAEHRSRAGRCWATARGHRAFAVVLAAYLLLAFAYGVVNPIHEATDEVRHYRFVRYLVNERALPVQDRLVAPNIQAHHPPLYYLTAALASFWASTPDLDAEPPMNPYWAYRDFEVGTDNKNLYLHGPDEAFPWRGPALAAHLARLVTALWGAAAVLATYLIGLEAFASKGVALGGTALLAFNPQFLYLSGAVNNDVPATAAGAVVLLLSARLVTRGLDGRRAAWLGLAFGAALLTKTHLAALIGVIGLAAALAGRRAARRPLGRGLRRALVAFAIIVGVAALVSGWWFVRNQVLYGEPTGFERVTQIWGVRDPRDSLLLAVIEMPYAWSALWGRFGYGQIPLPGAFYALMLVIVLAGLGGLVFHLGWRAARVTTWGRAWPPVIAVLGAQAAGMAVVLAAYILVSPAGAMGRFYFPGLPALGLLVAAGWAALSAALARSAPLKGVASRAAGLSHEGGVGAALNVAMAACAVVALFGYLAPAYAPPPTPGADNRPAHAIEADLGGVARLTGYEISAAAGEASPRKGEAVVDRGAPVFVTLAWEPLARTEQPLSVFVHLLGLYDLPVAMRATYTGLGAYPSTWWEPGRPFVETYRVDVPETAFAPDWLRVEAGLFDAKTGARLPVRGDSPNASADAVVLGQVNVPPYPGYGEAYPAAIPNPLAVNFGDRVALVGYDIYPRVVSPARNSFVTLYWKALRPLEDEAVEDLRVFLQAIGEDGEVHARHDGYPQRGLSLPSTWTPGEVIEDQRRVRFPEGTEPGFYLLQVGWLDQASGRRLPIIADDGLHQEGDALDLPRLRVVETDEEVEWWLKGRGGGER